MVNDHSIVEIISNALEQRKKEACEFLKVTLFFSF